MKDVLIGTITGVSAVVATAFFTSKPPPPPATPPVIQQVIADYDRPFHDGFSTSPTTQPDPAARKLEKVLEHVEVKNGQLDQLLAYLADATDVNMAVNWRALEAAGIQATCPVTLDLRQLPARIVLKEALKEAGGVYLKLTFHCTDGIVRVSTADELAHDAFTCVYDIDDLVNLAIERPRKRNSDDGKTLTEQDAIDALVRLIEDTIDPTLWRDAGGEIGSIRFFGGKLIVTQTVEGHEQLRELFAALRRKRTENP